MTPEAGYDACAGLVARGDPERFRSAMLAPLPGRGHLMALYAFNLEVARAPLVASEPLLAEMRLQWWADALAEIYDGKPPRAHEVTAPLADTIRAAGLPQAPFAALIAARRDDAHPGPPESRAALHAYLEATAAGLTWLAGAALGAPAAAEPAIRAHGWASGAANLLRALPALKNRGREALPGAHNAGGRHQLGHGVQPPLAEEVRSLAEAGLRKLAEARRARPSVPTAAHPALMAGWQAERVLKRLAREPERLFAGGVEVAPFRARLAFLARATTGRW